MVLPLFNGLSYLFTKVILFKFNHDIFILYITETTDLWFTCWYQYCVFRVWNVLKVISSPPCRNRHLSTIKTPKTQAISLFLLLTFIL